MGQHHGTQQPLRIYIRTKGRPGAVGCPILEPLGVLDVTGLVNVLLLSQIRYYNLVPGLE